jgi:hypothetical protein
MHSQYGARGGALRVAKKKPQPTGETARAKLRKPANGQPASGQPQASGVAVGQVC